MHFAIQALSLASQSAVLAPFCSINSSSRGTNPRITGSLPEDCAD